MSNADYGTLSGRSDSGSKGLPKPLILVPVCFVLFFAAGVAATVYSEFCAGNKHQQKVNAATAFAIPLLGGLISIICAACLAGGVVKCLCKLGVFGGSVNDDTRFARKGQPSQAEMSSTSIAPVV